MHTVSRLVTARINKFLMMLTILCASLICPLFASADITIFHVNDTHARITPHKWIIPGHNTEQPVFEDVGGAAYLAGKMLQMTATNPDALVIDAGDISEGNPIGDFSGSTNPLQIGSFVLSGCAIPATGSSGSNCGMTQFYQLLSKKLQVQRGRGMDAVVVGNHDVRDAAYINNLMALKNSGVPVLSVNVRDKNTHLPYFEATKVIALANGKKVGIIGYTTDAAEVGSSLASTLEVVPCGWSGNASCNISDYVNDLRNNKGVDIVILAAHIGNSGLVDATNPPSSPSMAILFDNAAAKLPEVAVTGHWHTYSDTVWQPEMLNYKTIFTESASYMKYIGELNIDNTGKYLSAAQHVIRNADITPDADVQVLVDNFTTQYNAAHPGHPVDEVIGYTGDALFLDNLMRWWSANEYPWSGNNTAGQWICDAMRWKAEQLFGQCDLAMETGGGVRADIPAGPVTYRQIYETFPWNDDLFNRINMTGQEIVNFLKQTNIDAGFSSALDVTAYDGTTTSVLFNGQPIDLNKTYTVAINNYMYAHPPTGWTWSDTAPLTSTVLCRDGIVDFMRQFTIDKPYQVGGDRYHLNDEYSGGYRAVVMMMNDNDSKTSFEDAFIRLLSATPETLARRGGKQVPSDLVNADGTINPANRLSENEMYRSYLGFKTGVLKAGDIIETWGKGSSYGGNPEFVDQEGIAADGVEFKIVGHDDSLAKPAYMPSIGSFWDDAHKNRFVKFIAKKAGTDTVTDQFNQTIKIWNTTAYASYSLPGSVGDMLVITGIPTMESFALRFRGKSAVVDNTLVFPTPSTVSSTVIPVPAGTTGSTLTLNATAAAVTTVYSLVPVADAQVVSGAPTSNYGTSTNLYIQSSNAGSYKNERAWLRFDLSSIPSSATITGATLQMWNWKSTGATMPAEVHGGSSDTWVESGTGSIAWNNQPAYGSALDTQSLVSGVKNVWYNWDVTSFAQTKFSGNKLVSLMVKAVNEDSTDTTAPSYAFDAKEYGSNTPILKVTTQGGAATVSNVQFYYRYSSDNGTWGSWIPYGTATTAPYTTIFNYPQGYGYYEFYSRATDGGSSTEPAPAFAQTATHYTAAPAYTTAAIVSVNSLTAIYDGTAKQVGVTTIPPGLAYTVTYNGSTTPPTAAGTYTVNVSVNQPGYAGTANGMLFIDKGTASIVLGGLDQAYDGQPKNVTVATDPAGLNVSVTYNGSAVLPVNAGNYEVLAAVNDMNYKGSASGTLSIKPASEASPVPALEPVGLLTALAIVCRAGRKRRNR